MVVAVVLFFHGMFQVVMTRVNAGEESGADYLADFDIAFQQK